MKPAILKKHLGNTPEPANEFAARTLEVASSRPLSQEELLRRLVEAKPLVGIPIGDIDFTGYTFKIPANFEGAIFAGRTVFQHTQFPHGASFKKAQFQGPQGVNFVEARFSGPAAIDFSGAEFTGKARADFSLAHFSGEKGTLFYRTAFLCEEGVDFSGVVFSGPGEVQFKETVFGERSLANFHQTQTENPQNVLFQDTDLGLASFLETEVGQFRLNNVTFHKPERYAAEDGSASSSPGMKTKSKGANLFARLLDEKRERTVDEAWNEFAAIDQRRSVNRDYYLRLEILYRQLSRQFEKEEDYDRAGDFYYGAMEMQRLRKKPWNRILCLNFVYKIVTGYGERWRRALVCFLLVWLLGCLTNPLWMAPYDKKGLSVFDTSLVDCSHTFELCQGVQWAKSARFTLKTMLWFPDSPYRMKAILPARLSGVLQSLAGATILILMTLALTRLFNR